MVLQEHALPPRLAGLVVEGGGAVAGVLGEVHAGHGENGLHWKNGDENS